KRSCVASPRSEIGLVGLGDPKQILAEMIAVILGADRLQQRMGYLAPALHHVERLVDGLGILDLHQHYQPLAVGCASVVPDRVLRRSIHAARWRSWEWASDICCWRCQILDARYPRVCDGREWPCHC